MRLNPQTSDFFKDACKISMETSEVSIFRREFKQNYESLHDFLKIINKSKEIKKSSRKICVFGL